MPPFNMNVKNHYSVDMSTCFESLDDSKSSFSQLPRDCYNMSDIWSCDTSIQSWTICSEDLLTAEEQHDCSTVSEVMSFKNTSALCGDLRFIVGLPEMCDVRFLVGHQRVSVYGVKAILSTRSRVFYELLLLHQRKETERLQNLEKRRTLTSRLKTLRQICTPSKSKCGSKDRQISRHLTIEIDEFDPEIFRLIVLFLHCGKIDITVSTLVGVMNAADMYGVEDLRSGCYRFAERLLTVDTVLPLLTSTERYHSYKWTKHIQEKILEFISEKAQDVLRLDEFEEISKRTAIMIFMRPDLKATEERKWDAAYRWSRRYCRRRELNHFRRTMKIFTRRINFLDIPIHKLINEIRPLELVPEYLIAGAISHQSGPRLVIGQEKQPMTTPLKPPRRRLVEKRNFTGRGSMRRKQSSASVTSSSSSSSSTSHAHSCDSGFSSTEICARI
ncbi:serine-enriched protein-like [Liolophura sinensis]|uniref:serine-enriched protein-like n=1 Tax=Liolophura sinensis TaxID=3198878 RepID=UPI003158076C